MVNKSWRIAMACSIALAFMSCEIRNLTTRLLTLSVYM